MSTRTHKDFDEGTKAIKEPIDSEFKSTTYKEIKDIYTTLVESNSDNVYPEFFLLLDKQSPKNRKVVITQKAGVRQTSEGMIVSWKRHRVPYKEVEETVAVLIGLGRLEFEPYLEESTEERIVVADN